MAQIEENSLTGLEMAVIGMSARFPGAGSIDEFWENLKNGVESISFLTDGELEKSGIGAAAIKAPNYVKAKGGVLEDQELFDTSFFGYTPQEAEIMDPQIRVFHECAWSALENAGYDPGSYRGLIGIYSGASFNMYWNALSVFSGKSDNLGEFAAFLLSDKDYLNTRVSYNLNLKGPSVVVQTACSTSLVAIHMACRALLMGECDIALAGGVSVTLHTNTGYIYQEGHILSPDGHCRAFDAKAGGTVGGDGVGIVVLKRFKDASNDGDYIYAVVKGSAINNDGRGKAGFTAPSVKGQAEVIKTALHISQVDPESISYIETHGTGTTLGDPIEIQALKEAFNTGKKGYCALGSVKTNVGHLDAAAGVAGFIKTVFALKNRQIPPSLHFETPNPAIDVENSPFYVNIELKDWKHDESPLRAGVSSFGIGGTNAHIVLEESPIGPSSLAGSREQGAGSEKTHQLILLSAKTPTALEKMTENLAEYFQKNLLNRANHENPENPGLILADTAYTLQVGRKPFNYRRMLVCAAMKEAIEGLSGNNPEKIQSYLVDERDGDRNVVFMFSGQGSQYVNMGLGLYQTEPLFRDEMDRCFAILRPILGYDIKEILYPSLSVSSVAKNRINRTEIAQPLLFVFEYALAKLLMKWGIKPYAMIGHSIGEYVAACLAGVFSLEDALSLVALRGQLMQEMPPGSMLSVPLAEDALKPLLHEKLSLAAVNTSSRCVVAGTHEAINHLQEKLKEKGYDSSRLHTSHAFHSEMMEPVCQEFAEKVKQHQLNKPGIPYISNVTGTWITVGESTDPGYWAAHLRKTVRFAKGLKELLKTKNSIFVEVGPGNMLSTFLNQHTDNKGQLAVNLIKHPRKNAADDYYLLNKIGQLWLYGATIDWVGFYGEEKRRRLPLPTYPFEGKRYRISGDPFKMHKMMSSPAPGEEKKPITDWFYIPSWRSTGTYSHRSGEHHTFSNVLIFNDSWGLGPQLAKQLEQKGQKVLMVERGESFSRVNDSLYVINPGESSHYDALFKDIKFPAGELAAIIHLWSLGGSEFEETEVEDFENAQELGFYSQIYMLQAIRKQEMSNHFKITLVTDNLHEITGEERLQPGKATALGPAKVIPQEFSNITYKCIDVVLPGPGNRKKDGLIEQLLKEILNESPETVIAYRNNYRWVQTYEPVRLDDKTIENSPGLREKGVYLITGGLGGIGLIVAEYLARTLQAKLILTQRSGFPGRTDWEKWLSTHEEQNLTSSKIRKLTEIETLGSEVMAFSVDVANQERMQEVIARAEERFGPINGVIHAAGVTREKSSQCPVEQLSKKDCEQQFKPKVYGLLVLENLLQEKNCDFCLMMSSLSCVLGGLGFAAYAAANIFIDAFVKKQRTTGSMQWLTVNWDGWELPGVTSLKPLNERNPDELYILPEEGLDALQRILDWREENQVVVSVRNLQHRIEKWINLESLREDHTTGEDEGDLLKSKPNLSKPFVAPRSQLESTLAKIWERFFGFENIGIHDDFFELGGDSLKMITVVSRIHKELDIEVPLSEFINRPTIGTLAQYLNNAESKKFIRINPAEKKDYYVASPAQKRLYILQQMDKRTVTYNMPNVLEMKGVVDKDRLQEIFEKLIRRHDNFRASFQVLEKEVVQRIQRTVEFETEYYNITGNKAGPRDNDGVDDIIEKFVRPFKLDETPILRVGLLEIEAEKYLLMLDMHHIISDGISFGILARDIERFYAGEELPPLKLQYKDYSEWQDQVRNGKNDLVKAQQEYWLKEFSGQIPLLNICEDFKRPATQSFAGSFIGFTISKEEAKALKTLALNRGTTAFVLVLAIFNVLLSKISRQEDIIVGISLAVRNHPDLESIIGMFVNTLPLRNYPSKEKSFKDFLEEVNKRTLTAFDNQDYPFEELVVKLGINRDRSRNPLFDVMILYQNIDTPELKIPGLKITPYQPQVKTSKFDLTLVVEEIEGDLVFGFVYCTELFKKDTIERFIEFFKVIISDILENSGKKLAEIELISPQEKIDIISQFSDEL